MIKKKKKIIVVGLPKTGTSTLAIMLRILDYQVTGPDIHFKPGNVDYLKSRFETYDGFQDYPWCFEWELFKNDDRILFIELKRNEDDWWQSFYDSYGNKGKNYLSYPYFNLEKKEEAKDLFVEFYRKHYQRFEAFKVLYPHKVLSIDIATFEWEDLCGFLNKPLPKTFFGKLVEKPLVNRNHAKEKATKKFKFITRFRNIVLPILGEKRWHSLLVFLRKQGLYEMILLLMFLIG